MVRARSQPRPAPSRLPSTSPTPMPSAPPLTRPHPTLGGVTSIFNNAGIGNLKPLHTYTEKEFDLLVDVNLKATWNGIRAAVPHLRGRRRREHREHGVGQRRLSDAGRGSLRGRQGRHDRADEECRSRVRTRRHPCQLRRAGVHPHEPDRVRLRQPGLGRARSNDAHPFVAPAPPTTWPKWRCSCARTSRATSPGTPSWSTAAASCRMPRSITCCWICWAKARHDVHRSVAASLASVRDRRPD